MLDCGFDDGKVWNNVDNLESLIEVLTRNEQHKDRLMEEMDKSKQLDDDLLHQDKEIVKLETFINSPNGLNQEKVQELEGQVDIQDQTIAKHLEVLGTLFI